MSRLPDECLIKTTPEIRRELTQAKQWTIETELLAKIFEEISILAAERRRKKPVELPRPEHMRKRRRKPVRAGHQQEGIKHAVSVLMANARPAYRPGG